MVRIERLVNSRHVVSSVVALFSLAVYLRTLAPGVTFIDSGELSAVASTLGIAHPTGYPLFTLLGWLFSRLPIPVEQVVRLNVMAAVFCSVGVLLFFHLTYFVLGVASRRTAAMRLTSRQLQPTATLVASACGSLLLAFSETYWTQAVAVEVYSLHVLLLSLVTLSFFRAVFYGEATKEEGGARESLWAGGWWLLFAFALGLSFANHMTTILLAPGFLFLYFSTQWRKVWLWRRIFLLGPPFLLGLSAYVYMPVRASQAPPMNWGNTVTLERFLWHVTGKQYRVWIFSSTEATGRQLRYFIDSLPPEFAYIGLAFALVGIVSLWRANRSVCVTVLLLFVGCVAYAINYDIHDIDSYFLLAYFSVALCAGVGIFVLLGWLSTRLSWRFSLIAVLMICLSLIPLPFHYSKVDESEEHLVEDYTVNMFSSLQRNSLILSTQWDFWVSASFYYQLVKGVRPDVVVIDKELLRRSWYLLELERRYPWLVEQSRAEVEAFRRELDKFEHEQPYDPVIIETCYVGMIRSFIHRSMASRSVYVTWEIEPEFTAGLQRVPKGLAFQVVSDSLFHPSAFPEFKYRPFGRQGRLERTFPEFYSGALVSRGLYYYSAGDTVEARRAFEAAESYDSTSVQARRLREALGR